DFVIESLVSAHRLLDGGLVVGDKQVRPAVVVVVEEPRTKALPGFLHPSRCGCLGKGSVAIVVVKKVVPAKVGDKEIGIAIVVVVARDYSLGEGGAVNASGARD